MALTLASYMLRIQSMWHTSRGDAANGQADDDLAAICTVT
jgi:hypothetical protein